jgi:hypothetical protein
VSGDDVEDGGGERQSPVGRWRESRLSGAGPWSGGARLSLNDDVGEGWERRRVEADAADSATWGGRRAGRQRFTHHVFVSLSFFLGVYKYISNIYIGV